MNKPFFSVIIPSFNRYNSLIKAVDSVLHQTFKDFELIIIDDGSTDDTPLISKTYNGKILYSKQENLGVSRARNRGISLSSGKYIAFLDSDDIWLPEKLKIQADFISRNPDILIHQTDETWIRNGVRVNPMKKHSKRGGDIFIDLLELCLISPSAVVLHKILFEKYGLFDEAMQVCEDYDLWLRISAFEKIGFIANQLILKNGGHEDQLSTRFPGMDRYRIYSILKLLDSSGNSIKPEYKTAATGSLLKKCRIYKKGAEKRGNYNLMDLLDKITNNINNSFYNSKDYPSLLKI